MKEEILSALFCRTTLCTCKDRSHKLSVTTAHNIAMKCKPLPVTIADNHRNE